VTINVLGVNGAQSFSPNPATLPAGQMVVWHNIDSITHRVVLNDGSLDTGNIAPGASSQPMSLNMDGPYHCSIHPSMVGTLVPAASASRRQ
jgi:plastocyanin